MRRFKQVMDGDGPVFVTSKGISNEVYAVESCKHCYGRGWVGWSFGCGDCLGTGKKAGSDCGMCRGTGDGDGKYRVMCRCLVTERELDELDQG
jgi:hypothetical protein